MTEKKITKKPRVTFKVLKEENEQLKEDIAQKEESLDFLRGVVNGLTTKNQELTEELEKLNEELNRRKSLWRRWFG